MFGGPKRRTESLFSIVLSKVTGDLDEFYTNPEKFGVELPKNKGGIVRYAANQGAPHLDPYPLTDFCHDLVLPLVYDALVDKRFAPKVNPFDPDVMCRVCTKWEQPDDKTYVFHLRQNVKWLDSLSPPLT